MRPSKAPAAQCKTTLLSAAMTLGIDEQVLAQMAPLFASLGDVEAAEVGDVDARRVNGHRMFDAVAAQPKPDDRRRHRSGTR